MPLPNLSGRRSVSLDRLQLSVGSSRVVSTGQGQQIPQVQALGADRHSAALHRRSEGRFVLPFASGVLSPPLGTPRRKH
ncbi:MAG: hypothetical protein M3Y17_08270 [Actinomycetota bacterium]|nr:hypothetical protein [Actinomycetota bacterium]